MQYLLSFLEGIITFISPCLLPMLPVYVSYFAGQKSGEENSRNKAVINALGFVLGFTLVFIALGSLAGTLGVFLREYQTAVNIICGVIMIIFGLNFAEILKVPFLNKIFDIKKTSVNAGFVSSVIFGITFSISWTPCVGAFLGSALMMAASTGGALKGVLMLFAFSLGLGIPFIISAILIDKLKNAFNFIKNHYRIITVISGVLLIILGVMVATGAIKYLYQIF